MEDTKLNSASPFNPGEGDTSSEIEPRAPQDVEFDFCPVPPLWNQCEMIRHIVWLEKRVYELEHGEKTEDARIGNMSDLTTTRKDTVVAAINEVDANADTALADATSAGNLAMTAQSTAQSANSKAEDAYELADQSFGIAEQAQDDATAAQTAAGEAKTAAETAQSTATAAQTAADNAQSTATAAQTAAGEAKTAAETAQSTATAAQTAAGEAKTLAQQAISSAGGVGDLSELNTTDKSSAVAAINETYEYAHEVETKASAADATATNAEAAANAAASAASEAQNLIGDLSSLATSAKESAVAAINEVNGTAGLALRTANNIKTNQLFGNVATYIGTTKFSATFQEMTENTASTITTAKSKLQCYTWSVPLYNVFNKELPYNTSYLIPVCVIGSRTFDMYGEKMLYNCVGYIAALTAYGITVTVWYDFDGFTPTPGEGLNFIVSLYAVTA